MENHLPGRPIDQSQSAPETDDSSCFVNLRVTTCGKAFEFHQCNVGEGFFGHAEPARIAEVDQCADGGRAVHERIADLLCGEHQPSTAVSAPDLLTAVFPLDIAHPLSSQLHPFHFGLLLPVAGAVVELRGLDVRMTGELERFRGRCLPPPDRCAVRWCST
jgi:hypothetical protein